MGYRGGGWVEEKGKRGEEESLREWRWRKDGYENKKRDILIEEAILGLARNLALEKFPGIHKDDPT